MTTEDKILYIVLDLETNGDERLNLVMDRPCQSQRATLNEMGMEWQDVPEDLRMQEVVFVDCVENARAFANSVYPNIATITSHAWDQSGRK